MENIKFMLLLLCLGATVYGSKETENYSFDSKDGSSTDALNKKEYFQPELSDIKYTSDTKNQNEDHDYKFSESTYSPDVNTDNGEYQLKFPDTKYNQDAKSQSEEIEYSFPDSKYSLELKDQNGEFEYKQPDAKGANGATENSDKYNFDIKSQYGGYKFSEQDLKQDMKKYQPSIKNQFISIPKMQSIQLTHKFPEYYITPETYHKPYTYSIKQLPQSPQYKTKYMFQYPKSFYSTSPYATFRSQKGFANSIPQFYGYKPKAEFGFVSGSSGLGFRQNRYESSKPVVKYTNTIQFNRLKPAGSVRNGYTSMTSNLKSPYLDLYKFPQLSGYTFNKTKVSAAENNSPVVSSSDAEVVSAGYKFGSTGQLPITSGAGSSSTNGYSSHPSLGYSLNKHGYSLLASEVIPSSKGYSSSAPEAYKFSTHGHSPLVTEYGTSSIGGYSSPSSNGYKFNINGHSPVINTFGSSLGGYSTPVSSQYSTEGGFRPSPSFGYQLHSNSGYKMSTTPSKYFMSSSIDAIPGHKYGRSDLSTDGKQHFFNEIPKQYESLLHGQPKHNGREQLMMSEYHPGTFSSLSGKTQVYDANLYDIIGLIKSGKFPIKKNSEDKAIYVIGKPGMATFPGLGSFSSFGNNGGNGYEH